ncbi:MAG: type IX secretion system membrane protein PorP/SprF, partial [Chlorobi bacterium]|nr:type IX secretion system membrane protein PorP/SprF [Chlorobiota bacterium]
FVIMTLAAFTGQSQDIHFSQYDRNPLLLNPAMTGDIGDCYLRAGFNNKEQWEKTYVTQSFFADTRLSLDKYTSGTKFGIGGYFYSDKAGDGNLKNSFGMLNMALHKSFNPDETFWGSLGFSLGLGSLSVDFTQFYFDNQWNGFVFDPNLANNEKFTANSFSYFDLNIGGMISYLNPDKYKLRVGVSVSHVLEPEYSLFDDDVYLGRRYLVHSDMEIPINRFVLSPSAMFSMQNNIWEALAGSNLSYGFYGVTVSGGLWFRVIRDIIPVLGLEYHRWALQFSYDVNISSQYAATNYRGGLEFSLVKKFCYSPKKVHDLKRRGCAE